MKEDTSEDVEVGDSSFKKELISANQKNGYEGVMEKIESYAPYEDIATKTIQSFCTCKWTGSKVWFRGYWTCYYWWWWKVEKMMLMNLLIILVK